MWRRAARPRWRGWNWLCRRSDGPVACGAAPAHPGGPPAPGSRCPLCGPGGVLVGPDHAGVDLGIPVQLIGSVGLGLQGGPDPGPGSVGLPAREPLVDRLPWSVPLGQVPPRHSAAHAEHDAVEDLAVVPPAATPLGLVDGSSGASRPHSSSVISNRRFTASFYLNVGPQLNSETDPRNML
jgi:hypothetical protein